MAKASAATKDEDPKPKAAARKTAGPPGVKLGKMTSNGVAASLYALVERGVQRHPRIARSLRGDVELHFQEDFADVRMEFGPGEVLVEDVAKANGSDPDLVISGSLPDIVQLAAAPLVGGMPNPARPRGRAALARVAARRVRIEGSPLLARRLLKLLEI